MTTIAKETKKVTKPAKVAKVAIEGEISKLRIRVRAYEHKILDASLKQIMDTAIRYDVKFYGPIPLPTHKRIYTVLKSPHVNKKAREQFELCSYKRLLDIYSSSSKTVDALMRLELPSGVDVEIKV